MTLRWNKARLSEKPGVELLEASGYQYVDAEILGVERQGLHEILLAPRLTKTLRRLNVWLSDDNAHKAVSASGHVQ